MDQTAGANAKAPLVTAGFAPLADFAGFGEYEAMAVQDTLPDLVSFSDRLASNLSAYLQTRPESAMLMGGSGPSVNKAAVRHWLTRSGAGPFNEDLASMVREMSHLPGKGATFPGVEAALDPQMVLALMGWVQGELLGAMGEICDEETLSSTGGAWMNLMMLQLGIMLEPYLDEPSGPMAGHGPAEFHPYAKFAGFGAQQARILARTGPLLAPAAGGVISLAYDYLLSRTESAGYFQDASHLAKRKMTLKAWWARSTTRPMDAEFHSYMSKVADAHVCGAGEDPHLMIPHDLTIALMGWVQMRVMTALNTIARGEDGESYVFGVMGEPVETAAIGTAWMRMLTLQLGILLGPYLKDLQPAMQGNTPAAQATA